MSEITVMEPVSLPAMITSENTDTQIATAKRFPRDMHGFHKKVMSMATKDEETAGTMFYVLKRSGKNIEGESVRLAEIAVVAWGNMKSGCRPIEVGRDFVTAEGVAWDLENNIYFSTQVQRRITDSYGRRYNDDMIRVTMNAASAIAWRNAIFKVIPRAYIKEIYEKAKEVSVGKGLSLEKQVDKMLAAYKTIGVEADTVFKLIGKKGIEDVDLSSLIQLRGTYTALKDGETTVDELLEEIEGKPKRGPQRKSEAREYQDKSKTDAAAENPQPPETEEPQPPPEEQPAHDTPAPDNKPEKPAKAPKALSEADMEGAEWVEVTFGHLGRPQTLPKGGKRFSGQVGEKWYSTFNPDHSRVMGISKENNTAVRVLRKWNEQYNSYNILAIEEF